MSEMKVRTMAEMAASGENPEVLFWVGCAGSFDDRYKKVTLAFIKILNKPGVKPAELAKKEEIDSKKYMEFLESTLEQITSSMDLDFDTILGKPKQTGLDEFFWS